MTPRQAVVRFAREQGLTLNASGGIPLLGAGEWFKVFDDWKDALAYLERAHRAYQDGAPYPWKALSTPSVK